MLEKICTTVAEATQHLFAPQDIVQKALGCGFMQRSRTIDPSQLVTSLLCSLAGGKVDSIAGLLRDHNDDQNKAIDYRAFHDRLFSPGFSRFMLNLLEHVAKRLSTSALEWSSSSSLKRFKDITIKMEHLLHCGMALLGIFLVVFQQYLLLPSRFTLPRP